MDLNATTASLVYYDFEAIIPFALTSIHLFVCHVVS